MCMCFTPKLINFVKPSFMLNNNVIPYVKNCKYLGIVIHLQSDLYNIKRQIRKFYANINMLLRKFSICSYQVKCHLYRSYCANMQFVNLSIPAFGELMRKCVFGFCFRLDNCKVNNIIRSIARSSVIYNSKC